MNIKTGDYVLIDKKMLMQLGFPGYKAGQIIYQRKLNLVADGHCFYANRKCGQVPICAIVSLLGFNPFENLAMVK
ncbi:hypothetical protein HMPREF2965_05700 [Lactobacillus sp. HMSC075D02]|uniref:DUF3173 family protein n=1 Tax=Lacticaseibacillus rhamnosus TaxID=47715 RepID=UPI000668E96B|nr:DUF3173 family protein [Lacticaseibacillus rhamnosus]MDM7524867.1 DUF3173 family protein [Lacticaseibacillus rhamnosus]OFP96168.1 hypothetical protein HMPREF2965_05700 [Lactobacillus sp. HMSC075D02]QEW13327.1 DUF3173 domain-containing protein [Lacticaseibacillus rhamnosus]